MTDPVELSKRLREDLEEIQTPAMAGDIYQMVLPEDLSEAATLIEAQAARIERLEQALKPFATEGDCWAEIWEDAFVPNLSPTVDNPDDVALAKFTVGNLRTAARALNGGE